MAADQTHFPELKISVMDDGTVMVTPSDPGVQPAHDGKVDEDPLLLETLTTIRNWLNQLNLTIGSDVEAKLVGKLLFRLLFPLECKAKQLVVKKFSEARDSKPRQTICIQLEFWNKRADLANLPWEFLTWDDAPPGAGPKYRNFVATANYLILTRFYAPEDGREREALASLDLPIRMLPVVSTKGGKHVKKDALNAIRNFASEHPQWITLDRELADPSYSCLKSWLEVNSKKPPQIMHFLGHGRYNQDKKQGEVAMESDSGVEDQVDWVDEDRFQKLFTESGCIPKLLFLQLCEVGKVEKEDLVGGFAGLVPTLIAANIQAVVAMQFPIENKHASHISTKFYEELAKGNTIGMAVQAARSSTVSHFAGAGFTPVLYMYGYDGAIVSTPVTQESTGGGVEHIGSTSKPEESPKEVRPRPAQEPMQATPAGGGSTGLDAVAAAGDDAIAAIRKQYANPRDLPDEFLSLTKTLRVKVIPELQNKTAREMERVLADFCAREVGTQLRMVLDKMYDVAVRLP